VGRGGLKARLIDEDATVVKRLDKAGAGAGGEINARRVGDGRRMVRRRDENPWNTNQGSSGSSAGPASATAAGCVAFSIGPNAWLDSSPSTRCGCTGLRPSFVCAEDGRDGAFLEHGRSWGPSAEPWKIAHSS